MAGYTEISYISGPGRKVIRPIQKSIGGPSRDLARVGFLDSAPDPTDPDSIPNTSWWDSQWSCADWITWHKANVVAYGQTVANNKVIQYGSAVSDFASDSFCSYDSTFYNYFTSQGVLIGGVIAPLVVSAQNVATNAGSTLTSLSQAASNTAGTLSWLLPVGVVVSMIGVAWWAKKEFIDQPAVRGLKRKKVCLPCMKNKKKKAK